MCRCTQHARRVLRLAEPPCWKGVRFPYPCPIPEKSRSSLKEDISTDEDLVGNELMFDPLDEESLESVYTDECRSSLESLRTVVLGACDAEKDVMTFERRVFPGMYSPLLYYQLADFTVSTNRMSEQHSASIATFTPWT